MVVEIADPVGNGRADRLDAREVIWEATLRSAAARAPQQPPSIRSRPRSRARGDAWRAALSRARCRRRSQGLDGVLVARTPEHPPCGAGIQGALHLGADLRHPEQPPIEGVIAEVLDPGADLHRCVRRALADASNRLEDDLVGVRDGIPVVRDAKMIGGRIAPSATRRPRAGPVLRSADQPRYRRG